MPLHGGICAFDPEHTPIPQDLGDTELPEWFPTWLHNYQRRNLWPFSAFGPLPPIIQEDVRDLKLAPMSTATCDIPMSSQRHPGTAIWGGRPLCPQCGMPVDQNQCSLDPGHDVSHPVFRDTQRVHLPQPTSTCFLRQVETQPVAVQPMPIRLPGDDRQNDGTLHSCHDQVLTVASGTRIPKTIEAWLREMDESGFLAPYHDMIAGHFDSPAQVIDMYARRAADGQPTYLDPHFLDEMKIQKLGHRRLFEKWFSERLSCIGHEVA